jgi:nucleotide-binding universal stress UspA family protein
MKILLAVDGSAYTQKMLAYLGAHPELLSGSPAFTALTVQAPLPPRARAMVGKAEVEAYYAEEADKVLSAVEATLAQQNYTMQRASVVGFAGEEIAKFADAGGFDLLIMGSHGNGTFSNLVMGSVATKVLAASKVPVLLIR